MGPGASQDLRSSSLIMAPVYTTQVNSTFRARWLASSEVINQVLFTSTSVNNC